MILNIIITVALIAFVTWFVWHTIKTYRASTGTTFERLYAATKDSATIFWAMSISWVTAVYNFAINAADFFGLTEFRDFITLHFSPEWASGVMLAAMGIIIAARLRTLTK